jgi:hypothetical protein
MLGSLNLSTAYELHKLKRMHPSAWTQLTYAYTLIARTILRKLSTRSTLMARWCENRPDPVSYMLPRIVLTPPSVGHAPPLVENRDQLPWPSLAQRINSRSQYLLGLGPTGVSSDVDESDDNILLVEASASECVNDTMGLIFSLIV